MNENITKMLEMLSRDEEAQKKLEATHDPDEAYAIVSKIHGGYTKEEFVEAMKTINDAINQDLNGEDLAQTAGGAEMGVTEAISNATAAVTGVIAAAGVSYSVGAAASAI